ncbi:hypothetical protein AT251_14120 [Enterovibrio nigricans]|nr:ATP-binding protein [Enterovibrio nigricans]PKF50094.1 hypothetical protein AT251_14120 [Enterovibrio nigricans]
MVSDILEAAGRVSTIVQDLSLLSAQQQAEKAALNLKEVVELAIKWVAASRHCEEHIHAERLEDIVVIGHKGQLVQVVVNLLNNALDACENAAIPSVIVQCAAENGHGWISISDNGTGISDSNSGNFSIRSSPPNW